MSIISQFTNNPILEYIIIVKQIFGYLKKYPSLKISLNQDKSFELKEYIDVN